MKMRDSTWLRFSPTITKETSSGIMPTFVAVFVADEIKTKPPTLFILVEGTSVACGLVMASCHFVPVDSAEHTYMD